MLDADRWGGSGPPVVGLLHGFTQSGATWAPVATRLAPVGPLVAPDLPGHGRSAGIDADLWEAAELVADTVGPATYVGYSMGGRLALHLALARPEVVEGLVLVSTSAGIDDPAERAERRDADEALAQRVEQEGVERFVRWWLTLPMWSTLAPGAADVDARLGGSAAGLASSLRRAGAGAQDALWGRLGEIAAPTLVVTGALDAPYCARGRRLAAAIAGPTQVEVIGGAGHACHLERPDAVAASVAGWLASHSTRPTAKATPKARTS